MARPLRRVLAATTLTATLLVTGAPAAQAAAPAAPDSLRCFLIHDPVTDMWWYFCI